MTTDSARLTPETAFARMAGLDGLRSTLAELHVHRALAAVDPTAKLVGGNRAIRDHELFGNEAWVNTKTAWWMSNGQVGHSPVNWSAARDPSRPEYQLDLVALVVITSDDVSVRETGKTRVELEWRCSGWWLVPASELHAHSKRHGKSLARSLVDPVALERYRVTSRKPLTRLRLKRLVAANVVLT